jgi:branched-chain amino acid transport system substrate-binding protein
MKYRFFLLMTILVLAVYGCQDEVQIYRIGAVLPFKGEAEAYGRAVKNGLLLALDEINQQGINGKKLDILFEDEESSPEVAARKTAEMIKTGVPLIIGGVTSNVALAMAPVCEKNKVVMLSPTASSPKLSGAGKYIFRNYPSDTLEGRVMADYAVRRMKIKSVAIFYIDNEYGKGVTDVFTQEFKNLGGVISAQQGYASGTSDFTAAVKQIKTANPDAIYLPGYYTQIAAILKEIKDQKVPSKVISVEGIAEPMIIEIAGDAADGVIYPQPPYDSSSSNPEIKHFVSAYKAKFPTEPDIDSAFAYDALKVVAKAIETSAKYPDDLRNRIADTSLKGLTGDIAFNASGDVDIQPRMFMIKDGRFIPIQ